MEFLIGALLALLIWPVFYRGAPFVPTPTRTIEKMIDLAEVKPGEKAVDLGSGDGRMVIALAKAGAEAHGYEVNPLLVFWSRRKIKQAGLKNKAFIHRKSFWSVDLSDFNVITLYGVSLMMKRLEKKLDQELKDGARIVSFAFDFPVWRPEKKENGVYLYRIL
ncbi:MAG: SAM-dependent methyltransferase [Candidatus Colwellbacteria bacterium]|nr:SAM-dependent methyltransferase [Candidatus Colwellbacteria bacterium]